DSATTKIYTLSLHDALPISDMGEVNRAYQNDHVSLQANIKVRLTTTDENGVEHTDLVSTTVGRAILADILPKGLSFDYVNLTLRSEEHTSELQSRENLVCRL